MLVKAAAGRGGLRRGARVEAQVSGVSAATTDEGAAQEGYWMFGTGAGITVLIAAALGLLVGIVVVAQTIYAATVDHIREYGTLKAMGATNAYLLQRDRLASHHQRADRRPARHRHRPHRRARKPERNDRDHRSAGALAAALLALTIVMCVIASLVSINKVVRLDPAMVFKG